MNGVNELKGSILSRLPPRPIKINVTSQAAKASAKAQTAIAIKNHTCVLWGGYFCSKYKNATVKTAALTKNKIGQQMVMAVYATRLLLVMRLALMNQTHDQNKPVINVKARNKRCFLRKLSMY
jgi:hypothetical protein